MMARSNLLALAALSLSFVSVTMTAPLTTVGDLNTITTNGTSDESLLLSRSVLNKLPANANGEQIKWQPALDYDKDSCYNVAAIDGSGNLNEGFAVLTSTGKCRTADRLTQTNVYVRNKCNHGWCAYVYDYYFEVDNPGHRHDWEHIVVFLQNRNIIFVATSAHGKYKQHGASELQFEGTHPKIVYHKDGGSTHAFRRADSGKDSENPENHWGTWRYGNLLAWDRFPNNELRNKLAGANFGKASMAIKDDGSFNWNLEAAAGGRAGEFKPYE